MCGSPFRHPHTRCGQIFTSISKFKIFTHPNAKVKNRREPQAGPIGSEIGRSTSIRHHMTHRVPPPPLPQPNQPLRNPPQYLMPDTNFIYYEPEQHKAVR
jgi:hypothetical protein